MNTSDPSPTDPNNGRSSDGRIQVERVLIDAWHPVLDENGDSRDYRLELELYTRSHSRPNPCTIRLGHYDSLRLRFELKFKDINPENANVTLSILEFKTDFKETSSSNILSETIGFEAMTEGPSILVAFLQEPSNIVPWGFQGKITWQFEAYVEGEQPIKFTLTHHFELYAISESVTAKRANMLFQRKGIPRKALELYILVSKSLATHPVKTFQQYIAAIANVVHSHTGHIYDVWNGSPFYTSGGDGKPDIIFNINRWANYMVIGNVLKGKENMAPMVNCYDQTAAVWIGICLGLVDRDAAKLVWYWAKPFGFINPTHLVGWEGFANNAYFNGDSSMMLTEEALSPDRWGYWTHVFLAFDEMAIDATCGPVMGDIPLAKYLESVIDREAGKASQNVAWRNNIKDPQQEKIITESGGATLGTIEVVKDGVYDLDSQFWLDKPLREEKPPPKPSRASKKLTILPEDYDTLLTDVVVIMEERPHDRDSLGNKQKYKKKTSEENITHIYWRVVRDPVGSILINVYILESEEAAEKYFSALSTKSELPTPDILVPREDQPNHLVGKKSGSGRRLWQNLNVVVSMVGLSSSEELQKFVDVVGRHLKPADPDSRRRVNIRSVTIEGAGDHPHYTCNVGAVIRVTVTAEYGYGWELGACTHGCLFALWIDKPKVNSAGPHIQNATFHFLARMEGDEEFMLRVYDSDFGRYKSQLTEVIKLKIVGK